MVEQEQGAPRFVFNPDAPLIYLNSVRILTSMFDFMLLFGQLQITSDDGFEMKEVARAYLSPQHAKALSGLLSGKVAEYEEQFGPIPTGPVDQKKSQP